MPKRRAIEYDYEFKKRKAFPVPLLEMSDQKYRTLIHFLAVNWDSIKPEIEGSDEMTWSPQVFDYIIGKSYGEQCIGKAGRCIWNYKKDQCWGQLLEDVNRVRGSENILEALNKIVAPANRYFYNLYTTFCRNIVALRNDTSMNWKFYSHFLKTFNAETSTIPDHMFKVGLPHHSISVYDFFNKSLCRNPKVATMIFAYYFLDKPYAMPAYIQPFESMVLPNDLEERRLDQTEDESKDDIDEEDGELYVELSDLLSSMQNEAAHGARAISHEEEIPMQQVDETFINACTSLPMEVNDQKYRTLVHLLATNWDVIKPPSEASKTLTWNRSQFDYIMRIAYGDGYTGDIGSSIWDEISDKYWKYIIKDVNKVRGSKSMVKTLNKVVAPANRYYCYLYTTFSHNLVTMKREYKKLSQSNKMRITVFFKNFDVSNPIVSSHYIFELGLPKPAFTWEDYQRFKVSLTGVWKPIATMIFAHYFKDQPMPQYIPPFNSLVLPNTLKDDVTEDKMGEDKTNEDKSGEANSATVETTMKNLIRHYPQLSEALTTEAVASTSQYSGDGGRQQHTGGDC